MSSILVFHFSTGAPSLLVENVVLRLARASDRSRRAAVYTSRAAPRFMREIPKPTIRSGQADRVTIVFRPAAMMPIFASASFRAERNADCVKLPLWAGKRARSRAQTRFTASAPPPANDNGTGAGGAVQQTYPRLSTALLNLERAK